MHRPRQLLIATTNNGKLAEYGGLLSLVPLEIVGLPSLPAFESVPETGSTFDENSAIKAVGYARQTGLLTAADDSGLEVDALGGRPGVHSARYGGVDLSDKERNEHLLNEMKQIAPAERSARFVCSISLASKVGEMIFTVNGICPGSIATEPRGGHGFGYDPIFVPDGYDQTFGELPDSVKAKISHRARASGIFIRDLLDFMGF
jgi:XTP/dITP diphosphohydrolase